MDETGSGEPRDVFVLGRLNLFTLFSLMLRSDDVTVHQLDLDRGLPLAPWTPPPARDEPGRKCSIRLATASQDWVPPEHRAGPDDEGRPW